MCENADLYLSWCEYCYVTKLITPSNQCVWYCEYPPPYALDIDASVGNNSCSLSDVAECSIILEKNTPPSIFYLIVIPFTRQETLGYLASRIHHPL